MLAILWWLDSGAGVEEPLNMFAAEGLVGREVELALAAAAVRDLSEGRASPLVIEGEAGIGKTRLVECVVDDPSSRGVAVYGGQVERTRPFGVDAAAPSLSRRSPDPHTAAMGELPGGRGRGAYATAGRHPDAV